MQVHQDILRKAIHDLRYVPRCPESSRLVSCLNEWEDERFHRSEKLGNEGRVSLQRKGLCRGSRQRIVTDLHRQPRPPYQAFWCNHLPHSSLSLIVLTLGFRSRRSSYLEQTWGKVKEKQVRPKKNPFFYYSIRTDFAA